jgi:hypothetical protein
LYRDEQIAGLAAAETRVPLPRHANAVAVGDARRDPDVHRLGPRAMPASAARLARSRPQLPGAGARLAASREDHVPAHRPHRAAPLARVARPGDHAGDAGAGARPAALAACDRERALHAAKRLLEREVRGLVQIGAALGRRTPGAPLAQHLGEQIAEGRRVIHAA